MTVLKANLRAAVPAALRGGLLLVLAAGTTLWGQGQQRIASASVTINVLTGFATTLTADPPTIAPGGSSTLRWTTTGATSATLDPGDETISMDDLASGSKTVSPNATTTYTLTASDGDANTDDVTATATVTVLAIDSFDADDRSPDTGERVTLSWMTTGADRVELQESVAGAGNFSVIRGASTSPDGRYRRTESTAVSKDFRLVAYAGTLSLTSITVGVTWSAPDPDRDPDPVIDSFTADPRTITLGGSSRLEWETTHATSVSIPGTTGTLLVDGGTSVTPTASPTARYTLTARGATGTTPDTETVTINVKPRIDSFSASSPTITLGESSRLNWTTTGATSVTLDDTAVALDGNQTVSPTSDTTYELRASNSVGSNTETVTITVKLPPCVIDTFTASPSTITVGGMSTLTWTTTRATSVSISNTSVSGSSSVDSNTSVTPSSTTTYTLTASGDDVCTTVTDTETVTVVAAPVIDTFTAKPNPITAGDETTLEWTTTAASSVSIANLRRTLAVDGSTKVSPTATTTYKLTAENSADPPATDSKSVKVTVNPAPVPTASLEANPTEFFGLTDPVDLTWSTTNATSASIDNDVGSVTPVAVGTVTVYPEITTTYTLTASGPGGTAYASVEVFNVDQQQVFTATLTADPLSITRGASTTLRWTTKGADSATIDQGVGAVTPVEGGSVSVSPTATTTYTLTATSGEGDDAVSVTDSVTVTVTAP